MIRENCFMCGKKFKYETRRNYNTRSVTNREVCSECYSVVVEFINNKHDTSQSTSTPDKANAACSLEQKIINKYVEHSKTLDW